MTAIPAASSSSPSWLQRSVALGVAVQSARLGMRAGSLNEAVHSQEKIFSNLVRRFAVTAFGKETGIEAAMIRKEFNRRLAPRVYEDCGPWIERMKRGEPNVLWPGRCAYFAVSSGTTSGRTKYLPITSDMIGHFRRAGLESLCFYTRRVGHSRVFRGRHLFLGGSTTLTPIHQQSSAPAWSGDLSGIMAINLPRWVERHLYEPGRQIAQLDDWPAKLQAIITKTVDRDVTLIGGIPSWILIFAEEMRAHTGRATLEDVWPRLECFVHGGVPLTPFVKPLRELVGPLINLHEVYPASEGFIAAQDADAAAGLRLIADAGVLYEFLPMSAFDESRIGELGPHLLSLEGVRTGEDYALVMTTPGGLCRYIIGDIARFVSTDPPRLVYVGLTSLQLSAFGEHVIEKELTDALAATCERFQARVRNFHVAPVFVNLNEGTLRGRHEWWLELDWLDNAKVNTDDFISKLDAALQQLNEDYEAKRRGGGLDPPSVQWLSLGTFERWLRHRGKWGGQNKVPRCRSDRVLADELVLHQSQ